VCGRVIVGKWMKIKVRVYGWWTSYTYRNRTKKPLAIALSGAVRGLRRRDDGGDVANVRYKPNQNCHCESSLYNEYILIKIFRIKKNKHEGKWIGIIYLFIMYIKGSS
jgi:hypothetical protein